MHQLPQALQALAAYPQFLLWTKTADGTKLPISARTGRVCSAHDAAAWVDAQTACTTVAAWGAAYGLAFSFQASDDFFFVDIDKACNGVEWSKTAQEILAMFPGAAVEVSQSGTGLHIIGRGSAPVHGCKNIALGLEFYTQERFVALTGTHIQGDASTDHTAALHALTAQYFPAAAGSGQDGDWSADWTDRPVTGWRGPTDDDELIRRACNARGANSTFGNGAAFVDLWEANTERLALAFPPSGDGAWDGSSADAALAQHLAFWTGNDCERMQRLMMQSGLYREKYERDDYLPRTINGRTGATRRQTQFCVDKEVQAAQLASAPVADVSTPTLAAPTVTDVNGSTFVSVDDQKKLFAGCIYVRDVHKVYVPDGAFLKPEQFRVMFGGYGFVMNRENTKTTNNAFEAFTESQLLRFPKAHSSCFRPEVEPLALIEEEGQLLLNTYVPVDTRRVKGDPEPFLRLLATMLPDQRDQQILLSYMAAVVQYPGVKFQWWPVIQGAEGNGKSAIIRCLAHAVGQRYTHLPNVSKMAKDGASFNGWLRQRLFIGIEEIYVADRRDFLEAFKVYITNDRLEIEGKGVDQVMGDNRANGVMATNHQDGVPMTVDTRRYAPLFCAQQTKADKLLCGMTSAYFSSLYDWFKGQRAYAAGGTNYGYAVVADYLANYAIPDEFNPAFGHDAPHTSSTHAAIKASLGRVEQEVVEAVEQGLPGFKNGWISSMALDGLLARKNVKLALAKRKAMLQTLGYDWHPALKSGRVDNFVLTDGGKPVLYVTAGHTSLTLSSPADVVRQYEADQK